jgi:hypothetical protein
MNNQWYRHTENPSATRYDPSVLELFDAAMHSQAAAGLATIYTAAGSGHCADKLSLLADLRNVVPHIYEQGVSSDTWEFSSGDTVALFYFSRLGDSAVKAHSTVKEKAQAIDTLCSKHLKKQSPEGTVSVLVASPNGGLGIMPIGLVHSPLIRENYSKLALQAFDHACDCLRSDDPCGRVVLLTGPPGTGKSYLIRAAMLSASDSNFILIPPNLHESLNGPSVLPVLSNVRGEMVPGAKPGPIVLILEDGDLAVRSRDAGGDAGALAGLLNASEGLVGECLDIRIFVTSNSTSIQLDPAVMRAGRLCRHVGISELDAVQARTVQARLGCPPDAQYPATLADLYRASRRDDWTPAPRKTLGQYL